MMKTMKYLSMAALGLVGAIVTGCSSDDNIIDEPQLPAKNVVTLSATVGLDEGEQARAITRALTADGVKTFAAGETMALVYKNTNGETVKAVSAALPDGDYGNTATFTFELTDPDNTKDITYIYPAAMAKADGTVNYDALATQDGTLSTLSSSLDLATYTHAWDGSSLPTGTLDNQLAILAMTLKNVDGSSDFTSSITGLSLSDGTNNYSVTRSAAAGPIYVAILPTDNASITVTATDGPNVYTKTLTGKTYAASNGYNVSWKMTKHEPAIGDLYYSDGTCSSTLLAGKTPVGVIGYLDQPGTDDDEITEGSNGGGHGLVLCLKNAASNLSWSTNYSSQAYTGNAYVTDANGLTRLTGASGYNATNAMASVENATTVYPAAYQAKNYTGLAAPATGTTGWFLPSAQQWVKMQQALGGMDGSIGDKTIQDLGHWFDNEISGCTAWETALAKAGSGNYDSMTPYLYYFTSSEHSEQYTILLKMDGRKSGNAYGFCWSQFSKVQLDNKSRVRPALAF